MSSKVAVGALGGIVGGALTCIPVAASLGQDQPLSLFMVVSSFVLGPFAMLVPPLLVAFGSAIGVLFALVVYWVWRKFNDRKA